MSVRMVALGFLSVLAAQAQTLMRPSAPGDQVHLVASDAVILESREPRAELPCSVTPVHPQLGFDLGFHAGYGVLIPLQELGDSGNRLTVIFRVTPLGRPGNPTYFLQKWNVPARPENTKSNAYLHGGFVLGEGSYQVDWMLRDHQERTCAAFWRINAEDRSKERFANTSVEPGTVRAESKELFEPEAPITRDAAESLHVLVLVHVAPRNPGSPAIPEAESQALVAMLRRIAREPRIRTYSVTAFNLEQRTVLYRSDDAPGLDFPALGAAIKKLNLGSIDVHTLSQPDSQIEFLSMLTAEAISTDRPDAIVFVGVKTTPDNALVGKALKDAGESPGPVFYLTYESDPLTNPWRDPIGSMVKAWRGLEYTITKPADLVTAWAKIMTRISPRVSVSAPSREQRTANGLIPKK